MPRRRRIVVAMLAAMLLATVLLLPSAHATSQPARASAASAAAVCSAAMHDPHWSPGGGTVLAKLTWTCPAGASIEYDMKLYVCNYTPFVDGTSWRCTLKQLKQHRAGGPVSGSGTRYIPETGKKVRGCGNWFVNATIWYQTGDGKFLRSPHYMHDCHAP
jgi:hypothetical protein